MEPETPPKTAANKRVAIHIVLDETSQASLRALKRRFSRRGGFVSNSSVVRMALIRLAETDNIAPNF